MKSLTICTKNEKQVIDITDKINGLLDEKKSGLCTIFVTHTTASITTADLDLGTDLDMLDAFYAMVPQLNYRHPHDPTHVRDHILSSIIGTSVTIPYEKGKLCVGLWQRVVLIEFSGPRDRKILISS